MFFKKKIEFKLVGNRCKISTDIDVKYPCNISFGDEVVIEKKAMLDATAGSIKIGSFVQIMPYAVLMCYGGEIVIGDYCSVNPFTIIYGHGGVRIGNGVRIAAHCTIIPANHNFKRKDEYIYKQGMNQVGIIIKDDVWIGTGCRILDGVTIGEGSVVAAGAVVTKSLDNYGVYAGVPAKKIGER